MQPLIVALGAAALVAATAWRFGALDVGGACAATLVGAAVFGFGGLGPAILLVLFFASASALSALPGRSDRSRRSARQVFANGSIAALAVALFGSDQLADLLLIGAVAAATADTWATEIGVRFGKNPRSILTFRPRPPGTSGAVSLAGTVASVAGAVGVGLAGVWLTHGQAGPALIAGIGGGVAGSLVDSVLGDSLQARYRCSACKLRPQVARHGGCHERAEHVGGVPGLDNDVVNWITTLTGTAIAAFVHAAA